MNYLTSLRYLDSFLNLERISVLATNRRWNLARMHFLVDWFSHPERDFFPILIAGTKGKGSTGFFLDSILRAAAVPAGFYSSPHLEDPRERIRIRGKRVSKGAWVRGLARIRRELAGRKLPVRYGQFTYFEIMTLLAILLFQEAGVRIGIFEIGMGGRLDATNVLDAALVILTPIHLDHEAFLGSTVEAVAREKAAIIRPRARVVVTRQRQEALDEIKRRVQKVRAHLVPAASANGFRLGLAGDFQKVNAGAALRAACLLRDACGEPITEEAIQKGLQARDWPGRLERVRDKLMFLLDAAHNPASIEALVRNLRRLYPNKDRLLIFGVMRDKKSGPMLETLSKFFSDVILTPIPNPRSQEIGHLLFQARGRFRSIFPVGSVPEALALAKRRAQTGTLVVITGSFYLIGEARKLLNRRKDVTHHA